MPASNLSAAISELAGTSPETSVASDLGPGITYLIELPAGRPTYFDRVEGAFPNAFYSLLESNPQWAELVVDADRDAYQKATQTDSFQTEARYRIQINRRGETLPVIDYRKLVCDETQTPVAIAGRLVDDSFRSVAFDSLASRSWKEIATSMTRRFLHDFNNTIAGIYSLSELYAEPGSDPKSTAEAMGHIRDSSIRAQDLTRKIRQLTTLETGQESYFDLGSLIEEQREYMAALLPKGAPIDIDIEQGEHPIRIDANLFRQVILHLTSNACDACGENAKIHIRLKRFEENGHPFTCLEFQDNGQGFKPSELANATTPFFTTKNSEAHPGLGLSIVSNFAQKLGGHATLANGETGALVKLCLPLLARETKPTATEKPSPATPQPRPLQTPGATKAAAAPATLPKILVYSWEDISRHPLLIALQTAGWHTRIHLEPGQLLLDLLQHGDTLHGVLIFKSSLDEKVEPLVSELGHARGNPKVALVTLGENVDTLSLSIKRNCGLLASGSSKPSALTSKLLAYFS